MGYLINSGTGFLKDAVTTVSNVKSYLINKTGYLVDAIRVGIGDFGQRVLDDGGTVEASAEAAASYREITKDIYDQASLVLFPSGYKDNLLYSHKPVDGSGDFTYTRGTDTATRVGADGYIKKERANLLLQSNQFDTTWNLSGGSTLNQNAVGIDNIPNTAWTFTKDSTFDGIKQNISLSGINTFSVYAKKIDSSVNELVLRINVAGGNRVAIFDLSDGTKVSMTSHSSAVHYDIQKAGNGWYRCSFVVSGTIANVDIRMDYNQTGTGSMLVQNAQLEQGLVPTSYIETTTAPVYEGLTDNLPRIDYTGGTPSILLEPSRTNEIGYSECFDEWTKISEPTITNNYGISPEGVQNSTRFETTSGRLTYDITTINADETFTIYMRGSGTLRMQIGSDNFYPSVTSDWVRYEFKTTQVGSNGNVQIRGNGSAVDVQLYGAQYERNSYPTSYIPTYNASATRTGEGQSSSDFSAELSTALSDAYTVFLDFEVTNNEDTTLNFADIFNFKFDESLSKDAVKIETYHTGGVDSIRVFVYKQSSSTQAASVAPNVITMGSRVKLACVLDDSYGVKIFYNGTKIIDYQEVTAYEKTKFLKGSGVNGNIRSKTLLNKILAFSTALSEDDCEALTAL